MPTRGQKIRLAIFTIISGGLLIALLIVVTSQKFLKKRDVYTIAYENVSVGGLEVGSPVKYLGITVGTIEDIHIDPHNVNRVIVKVGLEPGTPIKADARADIVAIGITGLKTIEIRGGSKEAPLLHPGDSIQAGSSIAEEITGRAEVIAEKMEYVLNNLQIFTRPENLNAITNFVKQANATVQQVNQLLADNRELLHESLQRSRRVTARADTITRILEQTAREVHRIAASDTLRQILHSAQQISARLQQANLARLILDLGKLVENTNKLLVQANRNLQQGSQDLLISLRQLRLTMQSLNDVSSVIREDPSVLLRGAKYANPPDKLLKD